VSSQDPPHPLRSIVFFGTPDFAVPTLRALHDAGRPISLVVAQPSRPAGRGRELREPPVVAAARALGLPFVQPERVRRPEFLERMRELAPDLAVVVAFGQIFPQALLDIPRFGCVNVHASLLPRHRGAAPIQAAILAGDAVTGVTTMRMTAGMDEGPMLLTAETPIGPRETAGQLAPRLAASGAALLVRTLDALERGGLEAVEQDVAAATYAPKIEKDAARIRWQETAAALDRRFRAQSPWPGLEATIRGETVKLLGVEPLPAPPEIAVAMPAPPGTVVAVSVVGLGSLDVVTSAGVLRVTSLQRPGRRPVSAAEFLRAVPIEIGERLA
jgi:methionyl-tRNA formyltransferase